MGRIHVINEAGVDITDQCPDTVEHWGNVADALIQQDADKNWPMCLDESGDPFECLFNKYPCGYVLYDQGQLWLGEINDTFPKPCRQFKNGDCRIREYLK